MTTEVSISQLGLKKIDTLQKFNKELVIKSIETNPFIKGSYNKTQTKIQLYEYDDDSTFIIPFYYYQQLMFELEKDNIYPNTTEKYKGKVFDFTGSLLKRQEEIKDEIIDILEAQRSLILSLYCGFGKTILAIYLAQHLVSLMKGGKVGVCCHRLVLIEQWVHSVKKMTNAKVQVIKAKNKIDEDADIYVFNLQNIQKRTVEDMKNISVLIVDECHTICTQNLAYSMMFIRPRYCIGLSATPKRSDGIDEALYKYFSNTIIERSMRRNYMVYIYSSPFEPRLDKKTERLDWNECLSQQADNMERNNQICNIARKFPNRNILILCKRVSHVQTLYNILAKNDSVDMFTGSTKTFDSNSRILIVTCSKGGVGFDHSKLDMLIIAADVENLFIQYLGRVFRRDDSIPIVVDIRDRFQPFQRHLRTRMKTYLETGGVISKYEDLGF
jgi:superfamily II DNA or RNA helicase